MTAVVARRLLVLAAAALVCGLIALAVRDSQQVETVSAADQGAVAPGGWYEALAAARGPVGDAERTSCGLVLTSKSLGVTHAVLPCGARVLVRYGDQTLLTEVIDTKLQRPANQFELTEGIARRLGLDGIQRIEWRFATAANG